MIERQLVTQWLQDYVSAWKSYEPDAIRALFSEDVVYRYSPYSEPVRGREAVAADWLENRDAPGSYAAEYRLIALDGDTAVSNGRTFYYQADGKTVERQYDNIFVMHFDESGLCADFCEWYMEAR